VSANLDTAALRRAANALDDHATALTAQATALAVVPLETAIPTDCPLAGRLHTPATAAQAAVRNHLHGLASALTEAAADLRATVSRATEADETAATAFRKATR
jgi:hypothetical protein